ncbi:MAG: glycosyltransferase [Tepidisphaeraceae bacterium]
MPSSLLVEYILFLNYVLTGPVTWFFFGFGMIKGRQRMELIPEPPPALPESAPEVTVLIPAKDEGERIRACIESALAQDYPGERFRVVAIDDRSTDNTGAVMDDLAARHPRLRVLHIKEGTLPEGWTGKCNALHSAVKLPEVSGSRWLLFVDSDVVLQPNTLRSTLAFCEDKSVDLISLLPALESHGFWESLLVPLAGAGVTTMYLVALTNNDHLPNISFANGQYLLVRREVYDGIGGHERVRDRFCEDVEFARILKPMGKRIRISWGTRFAAVRMYSSLASIFKGWGRNFYAGSLGRPWRILGGIGFVLFCSFSAYIAFAWGVWRLFHPVNQYGAYGWLLASAFHLAFMHGALATMYSWSGNPKRNALLFPLGGTMLIGIFLRSLRMCLTGKVEWRGTRYTHRMDRALAAGQRPRV